jgi:hypothetical protein
MDVMSFALTAAAGIARTDQQAVMGALAANQNVLVTTLNQLVAAQPANQAALVATLDQILNAVTTATPNEKVIALLNGVIETQALAAGVQVDEVGRVRRALAATGHRHATDRGLRVAHRDAAGVGAAETGWGLC